jgi:hypothetical protein
MQLYADDVVQEQLGPSEALARLVDPSIILRAILMTDASDINLTLMEAAIIQRREFEQSS